MVHLLSAILLKFFTDMVQKLQIREIRMSSIYVDDFFNTLQTYIFQMGSPNTLNKQQPVSNHCPLKILCNQQKQNEGFC